MRDASPASTSAGATALSPTQADASSFEDKIMLFQLFDRLERVPSPNHGVVQSDHQTDGTGKKCVFFEEHIYLFYFVFSVGGSLDSMNQPLIDLATHVTSASDQTLSLLDPISRRTGCIKTNQTLTVGNLLFLQTTGKVMYRKCWMIQNLDND